eukprot:14398757-Ditylum_brightwellii.AAC.1
MRLVARVHNTSDMLRLQAKTEIVNVSFPPGDRNVTLYINEDKILLEGCNKPGNFSNMAVELSPTSYDFKCDHIKSKKT